MNRAVPEVANGFGVLSKAPKDAKVPNVKTLDFVALGIAIADRCEAFIGFHVEALAKAGGTRDELGMEVKIGGGLCCTNS